MKIKWKVEEKENWNTKIKEKGGWTKDNKLGRKTSGIEGEVVHLVMGQMQPAMKGVEKKEYIDLHSILG